MTPRRFSAKRALDCHVTRFIREDFVGKGRSGGTELPKRNTDPPLRAALALGALGIVFGDIGTSPLYAFRQCFVGILRVAPTHDNVMGLLSLVLWSLILIVFVRYIGMVMRLAHGGEGGILALLAFVLPAVKRGVPPRATWLTFLRRNAIRRWYHHSSGVGAFFG